MTPEPRYVLPAALACGVIFFGGLAAGNIIGTPKAAPQIYTYTHIIWQYVAPTSTVRPLDPLFIDLRLRTSTTNDYRKIF